MHDVASAQAEFRTPGRLICDDAELARLGSQWTSLWHACPGASPFQSPAWLLPWWREFGTGEPRLAVLRRGDQLLGLLPLYRLPAERKLLPIGVGLSDYHDALIHPDAPADAAQQLLETALAASGDIDRCDLPDLPAGAALLATKPPPGWRQHRWVGEPCPVLSLTDDLRDSIPSRMLRKWRMAEHRAERLGVPVTVERADDLASAAAFWARLIELHRQRWTRLGEPDGVLADPSVIAFHDDAIPGLFEADALRLYALHFGETIVAVCYALAGANRLYFYLSGFDEAHAFESPGTILLGRILEAALSEGRREMHFLRGGEAYKFAWGAVARLNQGLTFTPT